MTVAGDLIFSLKCLKRLSVWRLVSGCPDPLGSVILVRSFRVIFYVSAALAPVLAICWSRSTFHFWRLATFCIQPDYEFTSDRPTVAAGSLPIKDDGLGWDMSPRLHFLPICHLLWASPPPGSSGLNLPARRTYPWTHIGGLGCQRLGHHFRPTLSYKQIPLGQVKCSTWPGVGGIPSCHLWAASQLPGCCCLTDRRLASCPSHRLMRPPSRWRVQSCLAVGRKGKKEMGRGRRMRKRTLIKDR